MCVYRAKTTISGRLDLHRWSPGRDMREDEALPRTSIRAKFISDETNYHDLHGKVVRKALREKLNRAPGSCDRTHRVARESPSSVRIRRPDPSPSSTTSSSKQTVAVDTGTARNQQLLSAYHLSNTVRLALTLQRMTH